MQRSIRLHLVSWGALVLAAVFPARAIIVYGTGDPAHNTAAPTGKLAGSGWQWQGRWGGLLGTAVAPNFFLTASHVGGGTGQSFYYQGQNYTAIASYLAPSADLRLWQVAGTFPNFAPRYTGYSERGKGVVIFGCGTQRGAPVLVNQAAKGWLWGPGDDVQRWGTNSVAGALDTNGNLTLSHSPQPGDQLACTFDDNAGNDEAIISDGDSGGGMFLLDAGQWKLAGIDRAVEANFRYTADGTNISAAVFDRGDLYQENGSGVWELTAQLAANQPAAFFAVRVSGNESWIASVLAGKATPEKLLTVESAAGPAGPFSPELSAQLDAPNSRFILSASGTARFYRLQSDYAIPLGPIVVGKTFITLNIGP